MARRAGTDQKPIETMKRNPCPECGVPIIGMFPCPHNAEELAKEIERDHEMQLEEDRREHDAERMRSLKGLERIRNNKH